MTSARSAGTREVSVFGTDASGRPFNQNARVVSVDGFEIILEGVDCSLEVNNVVGLRYGGQKARYRVQWTGRKQTAQQGQVGLRAVETGRDIFAEAGRLEAASGERERRRYPRIPCHGNVRFRREGSAATVSGALTTLSEGGCYIETATTFPQFAHLDLHMNVEQMELQSIGEVHALQPGAGMGIAFVEIKQADRIRLHEWVAHHARRDVEQWR